MTPRRIERATERCGHLPPGGVTKWVAAAAAAVLAPRKHAVTAAAGALGRASYAVCHGLELLPVELARGHVKRLVGLLLLLLLL
jgi:hypothetical protein